ASRRNSIWSIRTGCEDQPALPQLRTRRARVREPDGGLAETVTAEEQRIERELRGHGHRVAVDLRSPPNDRGEIGDVAEGGLARLAEGPRAITPRYSGQAGGRRRAPLCGRTG